MVEIEYVKNMERHLIFSVQLGNRDIVYMRAELSPIYGVVVVDAQKFHELWKSERSQIDSKSYSHGNNEVWKEFERYKYAEYGFSKGKMDPVPIPIVSYWSSFPFVSIESGRHRTVWLLSKGCKSFPVMCVIKEAADLYNIAGAPGTELITQK